MAGSDKFEKEVTTQLSSCLRLSDVTDYHGFIYHFECEISQQMLRSCFVVALPASVTSLGFCLCHYLKNKMMMIQVSKIYSISIVSTGV